MSSTTYPDIVRSRPSDHPITLTFNTAFYKSGNRVIMSRIMGWSHEVKQDLTARSTTSVGALQNNPRETVRNFEAKCNSSSSLLKVYADNMTSFIMRSQQETEDRFSKEHTKRATETNDLKSMISVLMDKVETLSDRVSSLQNHGLHLHPTVSGDSPTNKRKRQEDYES